MGSKKKQNAKAKHKIKSSVRASISFPPDMYETLEAIAVEKRVSLAWVVRDAAEKYISDN